MKLKFAFLNLFLGCISLLLINTKFTANIKAEELQKVELNNEIKKGNDKCPGPANYLIS